MGIWKKKCPYFHGIVPRGFSYLFGDNDSLSNFEMLIYNGLIFKWNFIVPLVSNDDSQYWFRWWLGTDETWSHCLNQWWHHSPIHIRTTSPQLFNGQRWTLQWHHNGLHFTIRLIQHQRNIKAPRYWPFVRGIHQWPVNSSHKGPVTRKKLPFDDVIMKRMLNNFSARLAPSYPIPLLPPLKRHLM